jgi:hypothetical protein
METTAMPVVLTSAHKMQHLTELSYNKTDCITTILIKKLFDNPLDILGKIRYNNSNNRGVVRKHEFSVRAGVNLIVVAVL